MRTLLHDVGPALLLLSFAVILIQFPQEFTRRDLKKEANKRLAIGLKRIAWITVAAMVVLVATRLALRIANG